MSQTGASRAATGEALLWVGILAGALIVGSITILLLRRSLLRKDASAMDEGLMQSLRRMRDQGQISQEEYDRTRRALARKSVAAMGGTEDATPRSASSMQDVAGMTPAMKQAIESARALRKMDGTGK